MSRRVFRTADSETGAAQTPQPDESIVTIATYQSLLEADLARAELEMAGIEAFVANAVSVQSFISMPETGVELQVAQDDVDRAKEIISGMADSSTTEAELDLEAAETSEDAPAEPEM